MSIVERPKRKLPIAMPSLPIAMPSLPIEMPSWLVARQGAMTQELSLHAGDHGLGMTHPSIRPDTTTVATCGYCSTGCGLRIHMRDGKAMGLTPETSYHVNMGMACPKGWEALRVLDSPERATTPRLRDACGQMRSIDWNQAFNEFCQRFKNIQRQHGPHSVAFLSTGQIACEEMALLGALAKFGMGLRHGDGNTRQCMATAATAYKESFGFDAPPYTYDDFEHSDVLVFVGANPCVAHPIMWQRVLRGRRNRGDSQIIVLDPRRTETALAADEHLALRPKTDLQLLYAITHGLIQRGYVDQGFVAEHSNGFDSLREHVRAFDIDSVAASSGVPADQIHRVVELIGNGQAVSFWWTMGVNQSYEGTRSAQAIINLAAITGNIGRPGTGANSITGQCNAMGSRLWSNTSNLLGHRSFSSATDREHVADILGIDASRIPSQDSYSYSQIIDAIDRGEIKGLWVIATNPLHSWIDQRSMHRLFDKLDFLVVQDMYETTDTAKRADLLLPSAAWGEKEGTFINSERRYGLLKKVSSAPGMALSDFNIFRGIAHRWGCSEMFAAWDSPQAVFRILQQLSEGSPCDITGIEGYQHLDRCGGIQWPWTRADARSGDPPSQRRLFADGRFFHPDGKVRLIVDAIAPVPEAPCSEYPFWLLTGRGSVSQWHTQTRTSQSPMLRQMYPGEAYVEIHPDDAQQAGLGNGDRVTVASRRGQVQASASVTPTVARGQVFMPMHYPQTNQLTLSHFDPHSHQPSYKNCAVSITPSPIA